MQMEISLRAPGHKPGQPLPQQTAARHIAAFWSASLYDLANTLWQAVCRPLIASNTYRRDIGSLSALRTHDLDDIGAPHWIRTDIARYRAGVRL